MKNDWKGHCQEAYSCRRHDCGCNCPDCKSAKDKVKKAMTNPPDVLAEVDFKLGRPLAGIGTFWEETEKQEGRAPTWEELEPILCRALDVERDKHRCSQPHDDRPIGRPFHDD